MKRLFAILPLLILASCGSEPEATQDIDPSIKPYIDSFVVEANKRGSYPAMTNFADSWRFSAKFTELRQSTIGICIRGRGTMRRGVEMLTKENRDISISSAYWGAMNDVAKMEVVYHELSHCVLLKDHNDNVTTFQNGEKMFSAPASFMNSYSVSLHNQKHVETYMKYYLDELFGIVSSESRVHKPTFLERMASSEEKSTDLRLPASETHEDVEKDCVVEHTVDEEGYDFEITTCEIKDLSFKRKGHR